MDWGRESEPGPRGTHCDARSLLARLAQAGSARGGEVRVAQDDWIAADYFLCLDRVASCLSIRVEMEDEIVLANDAVAADWIRGAGPALLLLQAAPRVQAVSYLSSSRLRGECESGAMAIRQRVAADRGRRYGDVIGARDDTRDSGGARRGRGAAVTAIGGGIPQE